MSLITVLWSMIAAACLTLAAVHFPVWARNREARGTLAFSIAAASTAAIAFCELLMLKAETASAYSTALRWAHVPAVLLLCALAGFAYYYLNAGRLWLAMTAIGLRIVALAINFTVGENLNFLEITSLRSVQLLGEQVVIPIGVTSPWNVLGQTGVFLLMLYFADASFTAWRRGRRALAVLVGGSLTLFMFANLLRALVVHWGGGEAPSTISLFALGVVIVMGYALSVDLLRAKRLVFELGEREHEANLAADAASLGIWTRDMVRDTISATRKWRELFGFSPGERLSTEQMVQRVHADDRVAFSESLTQAASERGDYQSEFRLVLPDGRTRWIAALGRVEFDAKGRAVRSRGACVDITARKQAEQEMLRLRQDIAHVGRVSVMGQLSAALAHEIKQPLGAILRNAEAALLFLQRPSPDLAEIGAILEDIRNDDQRAGVVIDRMRGLLRHEELEMTSLVVSQVLGDVATLLRPDAVTRHVALVLDAAADLPPVRGDRVQIQQVLLNLVLNGMDSLEDHGSRSRSVAVTARRQGAGSVEISVADSGRGIATDHFGRIFEPFYTTKSKGMGMGLAISRTIVETHRGRLWAENNAAGGATFRFTLPIAG